MPDYTRKLLSAFEAEARGEVAKTRSPVGPSLVEALSGRELDILKLVAKGLSNQEISQRLFLALSTVKGHNRVLFGKLHVQNRTEAVARARELGLL
jgi:LuxR family maltose regulon positive regulatory protein